MKLVIISNRLPIKALREKDRFVFTRSEGGLATGLGSLETSYEKHWVGWPGIHTENEQEVREITEHLKTENFHPVFLSPEQIHDYYEGYSNRTLWPLCHYFFAYIQYDNKFWQVYKQVNDLFCKAAAQVIEPGDIVWVQDYQLMLLPRLLREETPDISIGYFHHIPFPSYELFRVLPERAEILNGLLGADLIAFHTYDYMRHFISAVERVLDKHFQLDELLLENRKVRVDALPMGINYTQYYEAIQQSEVREIAGCLRKNFGDHKLALSVDRLDYSKGILHRLKGFSLFLERHPEYHEKISLAMVIVPSRNQVDSYADLKTKIDETIGAINGTYSNINWTPVHYFYHAFSFPELVALYHIADIALITPLRDGMNLVCKEYLAAKRDNPGILILSEMAGAAIELTEALIVNPNDTDQIEKALLKAVQMSEPEKQEKMNRMQSVISRQTVNKWATDFVDELLGTRQTNQALSRKLIDKEIKYRIKKQYDRAEKRLIALDYDGTLVPFHKRPEQAVPTPELLTLLMLLTIDPKNTVAITSGRDRETLEKWFGHLHILLAAEHGAFYKDYERWHENLHRPVWDDEILRILNQFIEKTPRSALEIKNTTLVWHYRNVDAWLASLREQQLVNALITPCSRLNLQIMRGNKVVEIKSPDYNKGTEMRRLLRIKRFDFMLAIGDDMTDEDMFQALPSDALTIKIGNISENAKYNLASQKETVPLLQELVKET